MYTDIYLRKQAKEYLIKLTGEKMNYDHDDDDEYSTYVCVYVCVFRSVCVCCVNKKLK